MSVLDALSRELGEARVGSSPGMDGRVRPGSGEELAAALRVLAAGGASAVVRGSGSWDALGHPMPRARILLETTGLLGEVQVDGEDGVAHLPAGASVSSLGEHVRKETGGAWELPFDPASSSSTLGGCLATASPGFRFGHPRDVVLGLEIALATGERVRCGGRVVKNVTGYDLAKLYVGSLGTLGVIEAAWIRLLPAPEKTECWWVPLADPSQAVEPARLPSARAAAWLSAGLAREIPKPGAGMILELAGDAPAVAADAEFLGRQYAADPTDPAGLGLVRAMRGKDPGVRVRVSARPSKLKESIAGLSNAGAEILAQPARGLVWAFASDEAVVEVAGSAGDGFLVEAAPLAVRESRELFGENPALRPLQAALKAQYDPAGTLNPGRFAGRI
ncbi:MAG: FAD-binding oxidoreductase [Deltaproteobacteria bacterium]|nr:FAD-binding oxidoreductase [Deltaproteobacteria bacterium]